MIKFDQKCFFLSPTANLKKTICLLTDAKYISFNPQRAQKNYIQYFWSHNKDVCNSGLKEPYDQETKMGHIMCME